MSKVTTIRIKQDSGYSNPIPIGTIVNNIIYDDNYNLSEILGTEINIQLKGNIKQQLEQLFNMIDNLNIDSLKTAFKEELAERLPLYEKVEIYIPYKYTVNNNQKTTTQGDCTILKCGNQLIMIDCPNVPSLIGGYCVNNNLTKFTAFIGSHYHNDHMGGLETLINNNSLDFSDCLFYLPASPDYTKCIDKGADQSAGMTITGMQTRESTIRNFIISKLGATLPNTETSRIIIPDNNSITKFNDSLSIRWLNNNPQEWESNNYYTTTINSNGVDTENTIINNFCLCCDIIHGVQHFLWTADISLEAQAALVPYISDIPITVLKVQHHGVNTNDNANYLRAINPKIMIVEGTGVNTYTPTINKGFTSGCEMYLENLYYKDMLFVSDGYSFFPIQKTERSRSFGEKLSNISKLNVDKLSDISKLNVDKLSDISELNVDKLSWAANLKNDYAFTRKLALSAEEISCNNANDLRNYRNGITAFYVEGPTITESTIGTEGEEGVGSSINILSGMANVPDSVGYILQIYGGGSTCVQLMYSMGSNIGSSYIRSSYKDSNNQVQWTDWKCINESNYSTSILTSPYANETNINRCVKQNGIVQFDINLIISSAITGSIIATLPEGYRPMNNYDFICFGLPNNSYLRVSSDGTISLNGADITNTTTLRIHQTHLIF